jgi:hypothetical protein
MISYNKFVIFFERPLATSRNSLESIRDTNNIHPEAKYQCEHIQSPLPEALIRSDQLLSWSWNIESTNTRLLAYI